MLKPTSHMDFGMISKADLLKTKIWPLLMRRFSTSDPSKNVPTDCQSSQVNNNNHQSRTFNETNMPMDFLAYPRIDSPWTWLRSPGRLLNLLQCNNKSKQVSNHHVMAKHHHNYLHTYRNSNSKPTPTLTSAPST